eukprot:scaffold12054_cov78-Skeletonema_menzelii.AAC.3
MANDIPKLSGEEGDEYRLSLEYTANSRAVIKSKCQLLCLVVITSSLTFSQHFCPFYSGLNDLLPELDYFCIDECGDRAFCACIQGEIAALLAWAWGSGAK